MCLNDGLTVYAIVVYRTRSQFWFYGKQVKPSQKKIIALMNISNSEWSSAE